MLSDSKKALAKAGEEAALQATCMRQPDHKNRSRQYKTEARELQKLSPGRTALDTVTREGAL